MSGAKLHSLVTYLEMRRGPEQVPLPPAPPGFRLERVPCPEIAFYRKIFAEVGEPWLWWSRRLLTDDQVLAIIHDPRVEVHVLWSGAEVAGFFESDRRVAGEAELVYCGLTPAFIGRGLGAFLLLSAMAEAWRDPAATRFWLHTCDLDHPKALDFYRGHGLIPYKEEVETVDDPRLSGHLPLTAGWLCPGLPRLV